VNYTEKEMIQIAEGATNIIVISRAMHQMTEAWVKDPTQRHTDILCILIDRYRAMIEMQVEMRYVDQLDAWGRIMAEENA